LVPLIQTKEHAMPEVYVYAVEGRTLDQKRSLVKDITDAAVRNFKVPADAVMVQIMETPKTTKAKGGVLFSDRPPG
jgi:4-oxalocrotonate tautomerase